MKIQTIFHMSSPYRDDFRIKAYTFGEGEKTLCIVGSMRGDEIQQQFVASQMVALMKKAEEENQIMPGISISIIPSVNPFSINIEKRFWALDNTDINRMFPGYDQGETTQRIAAGLFEFIKDFKFGIQLASYYLPGNFLPHVRMIHTGFEDVNDAKYFGFPYVGIREPEPFDTVLLNYNWQIWNTQAFSLYSGTTDVIDHKMAQGAIEAISRFMVKKNMLSLTIENEGVQEPIVIEGKQLIPIQAPHAGILIIEKEAGQVVKKDEVLARIVHPYEGRDVCEIKSPVSGTIFFARNKSITFQNTLLFRIINL
ncbi:MAG: M14 family metallopeptidase [Bacteroidales bacterium]|nr:M14 family metallopeptidase [Bacteroidales bacterium]